MIAYSDRPAATWEHSLLSGNGDMGLMMPGNIGTESFLLGHSRLFLPLPHCEKLPHFKDALPEIRRLCMTGQYEEAQRMLEAEWERNDNRFEIANRDMFIGG